MDVDPRASEGDGTPGSLDLGSPAVAEDRHIDVDAREPAAEGPVGSLDPGRLAVVEAVLADVEHAMARLDAGTWGTCERCGAPLDQALLAERPAARACAAHA